MNIQFEEGRQDMNMLQKDIGGQDGRLFHMCCGCGGCLWIICGNCGQYGNYADFAGLMDWNAVDNPVETVDERLFAQPLTAKGIGADIHCIGD